MVYRLRLCIAAFVAGSFAACPQIFAQNTALGNSPSSSPPTHPSNPGAIQEQIQGLLKKADDEINVHGRFEQAADYARQAMELSRKAGDKSSEATAMVYLGAALSYQGRINESYDVAQKTLLTARESGNKKIIEQALNNLGSISGGLGRYEDSAAYFYTCLGIAREINDPVMQYMSLLNVGEAYSRSGEPERAEGPLQQALKLAGELNHGDPKSQAKSKKGTEMALLNLAGMEMARAHYAAALRYFEQVHASQPSTPLWAIAALQGMANADQQLGKSLEAISLFQQALALAEKSSGGYQIMSITTDLGLSQEAVGQLDTALASQYRALSMVHAAGGDPDSEWQIESHIGHVLRAMGRNEEALQHYQKSIGGIERLRSVALNTEEGRAGILAKSHDTYTETADLLVDLHRDSDAFAIAERGRARAFLDMLALARGGLPDELTADQAKREQALLAQLSSAQEDLWQEGLSTREQEQRKAKLTSAEEEMEAFQVEVRHSNPRYASIRYPEPVDVSRVQQDLLDHKTTLVEFLLGQKRSLVWVVSHDNLIVQTLPPCKELEKRVSDYRTLLSDRASVLTLQSSQQKINRQGSALYAELLGPIRRDIPAGDRLIVVPDGILDYLPFETLVTATKQNAGEIRPTYALETYSITYGPSASALLAVRTMNSHQIHWDKTLLAFGDPVVERPQSIAGNSAEGGAVRSTGGTSIDSDIPVRIPTAYDLYEERGFSLSPLPFTREEVLSISRLFPASQRQIYLEKSATEEAVRSEDLDQYRYIHFATHSFLDESAPERSGILFSRTPGSRGPGVLQAGEILRLKMRADLVTLSACSTGLGEMVNGEGILGLTRAFFYAGAHNLTVSLWNVNDSATSTLMRAYYARLNRGATKSDALREAKLQLLRSPNSVSQNPYFWGAFVLVGGGK